MERLQRIFLEKPIEQTLLSSNKVEWCFGFAYVDGTVHSTQFTRFSRNFRLITSCVFATRNLSLERRKGRRYARLQVETLEAEMNTELSKRSVRRRGSRMRSFVLLRLPT